MSKVGDWGFWPSPISMVTKISWIAFWPLPTGMSAGMSPSFFLGHLVDRGPDSYGVIQTLVAGIAARRNWTVLRGNHDQLFLDFIDCEEPATPGGLSWLNTRMGGRATLASYGI